MNNIKSKYSNYQDLVGEFGIEKIESRFEHILQSMKNFINELQLSENFYINNTSLMHSILDYFSDISRLKKFHRIEFVNEIKIISYESFWLLRRKPIQVIVEDEKSIFINEKFVFSTIVHYITQDDFTRALPKEKSKFYNSFLDYFFYFLKFRNPDAQAFELFILAFKAGRIFEENNFQPVQLPQRDPPEGFCPSGG